MRRPISGTLSPCAIGRPAARGSPFLTTDLPRHRQRPTRLEMRLESREQLADCFGASELLPEQPDRLRIRHPVVQAEPEEAHEGPAVLDLELSRVVGQRVQGLEHQDLERQDWVIGWAATPRSIRASERRQQRAPENLELDQLSQPDQWVA